MMMPANLNADRRPPYPADERVRATNPLTLGVGKALRCAYAQSDKVPDIGTFEPLIAALRKK